MHLLLLLLSVFCMAQAEISIERVREYPSDKMCKMVTCLLNQYATTLEELDRCIEINEELIIEHENDLDMVKSITHELLHYMRCKYLLMMMMRDSHHLCLWVDSDRFNQFAADMLEIYDKEFGTL